MQSLLNQERVRTFKFLGKSITSTYGSKFMHTSPTPFYILIPPNPRKIYLLIIIRVTILFTYLCLLLVTIVTPVCALLLTFTNSFVALLSASYCILVYSLLRFSCALGFFRVQVIQNSSSGW